MREFKDFVPRNITASPIAITHLPRGSPLAASTFLLKLSDLLNCPSLQSPSAERGGSLLLIKTILLSPFLQLKKITRCFWIWAFESEKVFTRGKETHHSLSAPKMTPWKCF